jgi:hypothetical protein
MVCPNIFLAKVVELKLIELGIIKYVTMIDPKLFKNLNSNKVFSQLLMKGNEAPPNSLKDSNANPKVKTWKKKELKYVP